MRSLDTSVKVHSLAVCALLAACGQDGMATGQIRANDDVDPTQEEDFDGGSQPAPSTEPTGQTADAGLEWEPWEEEGAPPYWARRFSKAGGVGLIHAMGTNGIPSTDSDAEFAQGVIAGGASEEGGWLMALDDKGEVLWSKSYPGLNIVAFGHRAEEGYWAVGGAGDGFALAAMDVEGELTWHRSYAREDMLIRLIDAQLSVEGDGERGFVVAGQIGGAEIDGWLARFDEAGELLWERYFFPTVLLTAVRQVDDGGLIAVGNLQRSVCYGQRVSATGELLWARQWGQGHNCHQVELFSKDGSGPPDSLVAAGSNFVSLLSLDGELEWQLEVQGSTDGGFSGHSTLVAVPGDQGLSVATGIGESASADIWWFELDSSGNPRNGHHFTRPGGEYPTTLVPFGDGWLVAGQSRESEDPPFTYQQSWLFRFGPDQSLEFTGASGIRRETRLPNIRSLPYDLEDVEIFTEFFGPDPKERNFETTEVEFSVEREERF